MALEDIKILVDEQTRKTLDDLQRDFSEVVGGSVRNELSTLQVAIRQLIVNGFDDLSPKIEHVQDSVNRLSKKIDEIAEAQEAQAGALKAIQSRWDNLESAMREIDWGNDCTENRDDEVAENE